MLRARPWAKRWAPPSRRPAVARRRRRVAVGQGQRRNGNREDAGNRNTDDEWGLAHVILLSGRGYSHPHPHADPAAGLHPRRNLFAPDLGSPACQRAQQTGGPFPVADIRARDPTQLIHTLVGHTAPPRPIG